MWLNLNRKIGVPSIPFRSEQRAGEA